eukprot:851230-Rhodomonas_salina.2
MSRGCGDSWACCPSVILTCCFPVSVNRSSPQERTRPEAEERAERAICLCLVGSVCDGNGREEGRTGGKTVAPHAMTIRNRVSL